MRTAFSAVLLSACGAAMAATPGSVTAGGKSGETPRHLELRLTQGNVLLPKDVPNRRERLDEKSENFLFGQFEVFIPAKAIPLDGGCAGNYIVRMPQTIDRKIADDIREKQALYAEIQRVAQGRQEQVAVVIDLRHKKGCNLFFRTDKNGKYLNHARAVS